jgi:hypothetical protein
MTDSKDLTKIEPENQQVDNFVGYNDDVESARDDAPVGIIQGTLIKFTKDYRYVTRDGTEIPSDLKLVVVDVARVVQRWKDDRPVETIILEPGQPFPDIEALNEEAPKEEWVEKFGKMRRVISAMFGPYEISPPS